MFSFTSIETYLDDLQHHRTSCEAAVNHFLLRIAEKTHLNAFLEVFEEEAIQRAKMLDHQRRDGAPMGKLHGVIVGLKDVISYRGHGLTASSNMLKGYEAVYNATVVERLLEEGAIIIGRQNCDEFAMGSSNEHSAYGAVLNDADNNRVPGGSSGGSAVSVQAGLCMVSLGSDTGGSVRQPADFCGVIGLKPSYGRISRYGLIAYASTFDQIGIFSTNIPDAARVLEVISGADDMDSTVSQSPVEAYSQLLKAGRREDKRYKLAYFKQALEHPGLDPEIKNAVSDLIDKLRAEGHTVTPIEFELLDYVVPTYYVLTTAEASTNLSRYDGVKFGHQTTQKVDDLTEFYKKNRSEGFGKEVKKRIMLGTFVLSAFYFDAYFAKAQQIRQLLSEKSKEIFNKYDALISPNAPCSAFKLGEKQGDATEMYLADIYTVFANLVGIPGISLPLFHTKDGMPFGIQLMSDQLKELSLLTLSDQLMQSEGKH
ncbi:Asp-tRNA(Asn)/Glu-tRNA(Gln) amidotransferase subunit GatA [Arachidicoccus terrestris]|nr:Asp-tRNA(Asn)/Glu-tRNA(Gln) amidotransferase subunit GatA [Arachidicoccus terrestris]UAY57300.1 Asp-tRNA(Asn)/Glu-tRNA(Gln) amidotransferase subunit GatA [Arachidicoccus terrestris]